MNELDRAKAIFEYVHLALEAGYTIKSSEVRNVHGGSLTDMDGDILVQIRLKPDPNRIPEPTPTVKLNEHVAEMKPEIPQQEAAADTAHDTKTTLASIDRWLKDKRDAV